jgi:acyl-coenzyme A thioesterase PaaI-like protein
MFPERRHENLQGIIHGAVTLSLIDISLFTTMHTIGTGNAGPSVTLELSTQFVGGGMVDRPLDAVCEIVRETGSMVFVRGKVEQEDHLVASFSGIVKKMKRRIAS